MKKTVNVSYERRPIEGAPFKFSAVNVAGAADFNAYIDGEIFWSRRCPDPPCHEEALIPENVAGSTLLIVATDDEETRELTFFINDDGEGVPMGERIRELVLG